MSSSGKDLFGLRGPKKVFIHRIKKSELSSHSVSSDSLSDSPLTSSSPGSFTHSLSPISLVEKGSPKMPVSDSPSDQSPDAGVDSLTSPSMGHPRLQGSRGSAHKRYSIDDYWSSRQKADEKSPCGQSQTTAAHEDALLKHSHDEIFQASEPEAALSASPSVVDGAILPSSSESWDIPEAAGGRVASPFAFDDSFDALLQPSMNRRHSLSPRGDYLSARSDQHHISHELPSTTSTSLGQPKKETVSPGNVMCSFVSSGPGNKTKQRQSSDELHLCQVCEDIAAGFHCGAYVCEACKKFFVRCLKQDAAKNFVCSRNQSCTITKETRTQCQFCRFHKCISLGMYKPGTWPGGDLNAEISNIPCKVCGASSSGYHFGAITCEGCKGFFRRTVKERDGIKYSCNTNGHCTITTATRNVCKFCRYQKCLQVGMTPSGSRIGRQPNAVKHKTMLELQQLHCGGGLLSSKELVIKTEPVWSEEESQISKGTTSNQPAQHSPSSEPSWNLPRSTPSEKSPKSKQQHSSASLGSSDRRLSRDRGSDCSSSAPVRRDSVHPKEPDGSDFRSYHHSHYYTDLQRPDMPDRPTPTLTRPDLHSSIPADNPRGPLPLVPTSFAFSSNISQDYVHGLNYAPDYRQECSPVAGPETSALGFDHRFHRFHLDSAGAPNQVETDGRSVPPVPTHPSVPYHSTPRMSFLTDRGLHTGSSGHHSSSSGLHTSSSGHHSSSSSHHSSSSAMQQTSSQTFLSRRAESLSSLPSSLPQGNQLQSGTSTENLTPALPPPQCDVPKQDSARPVQPPGQRNKKSDSHNTRDSPETHPYGSKKTKKVSQKEMIEQILEACKELEPIATPAKQRTGYVEPHMEKTEVWDTMMMQFAHSAHATVKFAKKVPGFRELPMQQQIGKVQSAMYQIVLTMLSTKYNLDTGDYIYFCFTHEEEDMIVNTFPQFKPLPQHFINMGKSIAKLKPDKVEVAMLCALCLFIGDTVSDETPESQETQSKPKAQEMGVNLLKVLEDYCEESSESDSSRYGRVLSQLTLLQKANSEHLDCVIQVKMSMPDLEIPQLYEETFLSI